MKSFLADQSKKKSNKTNFTTNIINRNNESNCNNSENNNNNNNNFNLESLVERYNDISNDGDNIESNNIPNNNIEPNNDHNNDHCDNEPPELYELFSVLIHSGGASGGHYYAYIKVYLY
jgi:hypothetical protein